MIKTKNIFDFYNRNRIFFLLFFVILVLHFIIFRVPLFHYPDILKGKEVLSAEELVPIFDFKTQFLDQLSNDFSELTNNNELRIRYSFLTSWVRYYSLLPLFLIILNSISAFILFYSVYIITKFTLKAVSNKIIVFSSFTSFLLIHLILLYSKITQFYTLIFGFAIFSLSISLFIIALFTNGSHRKIKLLIFSSLLTLINPGVHYHILYVLIVTLILFIFFFIKIKTNFSNLIKEILIIFILTQVIATLPYLIFINSYVIDKETFLEIPISYETIVGFSPPSISYIFTLDTSSPIDNFIYGNYYSKKPRYFNIAYLILIFIPIIFYKKIKTKLKSSQIIPIYYILLLVSIYFSLGYSEKFSFYNHVRYLAFHLYNLSDFLLKLIISVIQVLRFPHRFQFVYYLFFMFILSISIAFINHYLAKKLKHDISPFMCAIILYFYFLNYGVTNVLFSGDFDDFLRPYKIPEDFRNIKEILNNGIGDFKTVFFPSMSGGLRVTSDGQDLNLIDKFFIYYFNVPSIDYATSGSLDNRMDMYLLYRALLYNESWWEKIANNNDIKYIMFYKASKPREVGQLYFPGIERKIETQLTNSRIYKKIYNGTDADLYINSIYSPQKNCSIFINLNWSSFIKHIKSKDFNINCSMYFTFNINSKENNSFDYILSNNYNKTILDLELIENSNLFIKPVTFLEPFSTDIFSTLSYPNIYSLFNLIGRNRFNKFNTSIPGFYDTFTNHIVGSKSKFTFKFPFYLENGYYDFYLRGKLSSNNITLYLKDLKTKETKEIILNTNNKLSDIQNYDYYYLLSSHLEEGNYLLELIKNDESMIIIEGLAVFKKNSTAKPNDQKPTIRVV